MTQNRIYAVGFKILMSTIDWFYFIKLINFRSQTQGNNKSHERLTSKIKYIAKKWNELILGFFENWFAPLI